MKESIFVFFSFLAMNPKNLRISLSLKEKHLRISFCYYHLKYSVYTAYVILLIDQSFSGYRLFKFVLFLVGFLVAFFFTYLMCTEQLSDELSGKALEYKDQVKNFKILMNVELPAYLPTGKDNRQNNFLFVPVMSEGCMS